MSALTFQRDPTLPHSASSGAYVTIQPGNNSLDSAPTRSSDHISFTFNVNESGIYTLSARVIAPSPDDDSFWIRMDTGAWFMWNSINPSTSWIWDTSQSYNLNPGTHILSVAYREDGAKLDKLYITNSSNTPVGMGEDAVNLCDPTDVGDLMEVPGRYDLKQNYPNPFNPTTTIKYSLKNSSHVLLTIYDLNGKVIETLVNRYQIAGKHAIVWQPNGLASGLYFYRLRAGEFSQTKKIILIK